MTYQKISIITPTFNSSRYLEETLLSVINQNYPNLEYIIIDGGSTDDTLDIIKKYETHLTYWISEPDKGMYYAIQKGFDRCTGDIMAWLNSDDKYFPGALKLVSEIFSDLGDVNWIQGWPTYLNKDGLCVKISENQKWSKSRFLIGDYRWIQQESVFWRRSLWEQAGAKIACAYKYAGDFELWYRFFSHSELYNVSAPLSGFRLHGTQLSIINKDIYENEALEILKYYEPAIQDRRTKIIRFFFNWSKTLKKADLKILKFFISLLNRLVYKLHKFPAIIIYDFEKNNWMKI